MLDFISVQILPLKRDQPSLSSDVSADAPSAPEGDNLSRIQRLIICAENKSAATGPDPSLLFVRGRNIVAKCPGRITMLSQSRPPPISPRQRPCLSTGVVCVSLSPFGFFLSVCLFLILRRADDMEINHSSHAAASLA